MQLLSEVSEAQISHHRSLLRFSFSQRTNVQLILVDVVEPRAPAGVNTVTIKADLTDTQQIDSLFSTTYGVPETIYCLHGIMSRGSEDDFDFGVKVATGCSLVWITTH